MQPKTVYKINKDKKFVCHYFEDKKNVFKISKTFVKDLQKSYFKLI